MDLTAWTFWWEFNKEPFLDLKTAIHAPQPRSGSDGWFLGEGEKSEARNSLRPTEEQVRQSIVPALLEALDTEGHNDIVTGCLIALARIGDERNESGRSIFVDAITPHLTSKVQEIEETAALALGILGHEGSLPLLTSLVRDEPSGRQLTGDREVSLRTRAFAAYGLGLLAKTTGREALRREALDCLVRTLESDASADRDLRVACVISIGLVPLEIARAEGAEERSAPDPTASCTEQIDYLLGVFLDDNSYHSLVRAHVPAALARLLAGLQEDDQRIYKPRITEALLGSLTRRRKAPAAIAQSVLLALGQIGDDDRDPVDAEIRSVLIDAGDMTSDHAARRFALIALAQSNARKGDGDSPKSDRATRHLMQTLAKGSGNADAWAGLALGVYGRSLQSDKREPSSDIVSALREKLDETRSPSELGAHALALGLVRDFASVEPMIDLLHRTSHPEARGYVALGLGLMGTREAIEPIHRVVVRSKYDAVLLQQAAVALGLLGDQELVATLTEMLSEASSLASQAAIASALGRIGDRESVRPLVAMLGDAKLTGRARGFAAAALGIVADRAHLPWSSSISVDINYLAATPTLNDPAGIGVLNLL